MTDFDAIFKAYDVRGTVPDQFTVDGARAIGGAFARFVAASGASAIVVGHDMRPEGEEFSAAFGDGAMAHGVDVIDVGLCATDMLYYASGVLDLPGAVFTASHNPAGYNGIKMCLAKAAPIGKDTGLDAIKQMALAGPDPTGVTGARTGQDMLPGYVEHVHSFVDISALKPLKVVADTANGMGGLVVPAVFAGLPFELDHLYPELDGTFPNHPADPLQPANQRDLRARVTAGSFDLGLAFDGDADRVFMVDETGNGLSGSTTTAILAAAILRDHPGATVLHNLICSRSVPEAIAEHGGVAVRTRVGHSYIKQVMAETGAIFGGEHSAHYYFADNFRADSGLIASLVLIGEMSRSEQSLSSLRAPFERYAASGEINTEVDDQAAILEAVRARYASCPQDDLDGLTVDGGDWWFNLRASNTEPLLRLNLEAADRDACDDRVAEVLALITG